VTVANAISHASCTTAYELGAAAIITPTQSGSTARMVSKFRPEAPIIAATFDERVRRKLCLSFGVHSVLINGVDSTDDLIEQSVNQAIANEYVNSGDLLVITAGVPAGVAGTTNLIKVHIVGNIAARGIGVGQQAVTGKVAVIRDLEKDSKKVEEGDILVVVSTDKDVVSLMKKASAFIVEEGGITSHAAIVGIALGKPVIVGVKGAMDLFKDGQTVTMDTVRGVIYKGTARVL
jgi:pyruvate kinase